MPEDEFRWIDELFKNGKISLKQFDKLRKMATRDRKARAKAQLRDIDRYLDSGARSPFAQGGLPSLGKKRP